MYLLPTTRYYGRHDEQCIERGPFLLLMSLPDTSGPGSIYACVRQVAMQQCGHWMMGRANLCGKWVVVSGSYGEDGLSMDVEKLPKDAVRLPDDLYHKWAKGGGWNEAGAEAPALREWAVKTFEVKNHVKRFY